jgi:threonine dehydrogenase-like Zn-dependent dehydrogenase
MVDLRDRGWLDPSVLITHHSAWDDIPDAYEMYARYTDGVIKNVLDISGAVGSGVNA